LLARVAPRPEIINGIFKLHSQPLRHSCSMAGAIANVRCLHLTPLSLRLLPTATPTPIPSVPDAQSNAEIMDHGSKIHLLSAAL
jgi:hypothetical protein